MNHDKQQRVAEETAISERFVRRVNPFPASLSPSTTESTGDG